MADWWYYRSQDGKQVDPLWEYKQIIKNIKPLNDIIKEMSVNEAIQYIKDKHDTKEIVGNLVINYVNNLTGYAPNTDKFIIGAVNRTPGGRFDGGGEAILESPEVAWTEYADDGGYVSIFGNAEETENVIPYLVLLIKGTIPQLAIQAFVPQTTIISSILPYCGYSVDADFWKYSATSAMKVGQELAEYTQNGVPIRGLVPAIIDSDSQIWVDNSMIVSLQEYLNFNPLAEYDGFYVGDIKVSILPGSYVYRFRYRTKAPALNTYVSEIYQIEQTSFAVKRNNYITFISAQSSSFRIKSCRVSNSAVDTGYPVYPVFTQYTEQAIGPYTFTRNGLTVYYNLGLSFWFRQEDGQSPYYDYFSGPYTDFTEMANYDHGLIAWYSVYGDSYEGETVDGIEKREKYIPSIPYPPFVLKSSDTLETNQLTPITIPENEPWITSPNTPDTPSTDSAIKPYLWPSVNQDEFYPYDPNEYPDMAYNPEDATAPLPTPQNVPATQPIENPSSPGIPDISYDPTILDPPISGGISPIIGVPNPLNWPSIVTEDTSAEHNGDPGLIHVYNPSNTEMQDFGRWLWVTYNDTTLIKIFNNPFDGVIGAHELYATPASAGVKEKIRSGFLVSNVDAYPVLVRYTNINCGSIVIPEYWGNYLDYAPYTKVHAYLPFIGIVELEADDIIGHSVNINYAVDAYTGACIAQITVAKDDYVNTLYEFQGNCAVEVPITGGSQAAIKAGLITAAAYGISGVIGSVGGAVSGVLGGLASTKNVAGGIVGGVMGGLSGLGETAANAINNVVSLKSSVQHSGTFGSSFGAMGIKKPYIIVKRPIQKVVPGYNQDYGYPAHKQVVIGQCQGYLKVLEINVVSPTATNDEKAQIEALLKQGVYVS